MKPIYLTLCWLGLALSMAALAQTPQQYTCPMHPHYISTDPDGRCPICGMALVPVAPGSTAGGDALAVDAAMLQTMGVRTDRVREAPFSRTVRAYGNVQANTRDEAVSVSRMEGWIEGLAVNAEGDNVRRGQLLYRLYSPSLLAAQQDYLAARRDGATELEAAAAQRLRSLGMQAASVEQLKRAATAQARLPVYAEADGVVQSLMVRDGDYVKPGDPVMRLQSFATVWVLASVAEQDIPFIASGLPVQLNFPSAPAASIEGIVDYVYPTIDPATRTLQVRIVVDNSEGRLRPGAFADVTFRIDVGARLSVPAEAILRDARGAHVIVALGDGRFRAQTVQTGITVGARTQILDGLEAGDVVVSSGQFLLDSETNLREGFSKLGGATDDASLADLALSDSELALLDHFVDAALYLHEALTTGFAPRADYLDASLQAGEQLLAARNNAALTALVQAAMSVVRDAQRADDTTAQREALGALIAALDAWLFDVAPSRYQALGLTAWETSDGAQRWLQQGDSPANPYQTGGSARRMTWKTSGVDSGHDGAH